MKILRTIGILAIVAALVLGGTASAFAKGPPDPPPGGGKHSPGKSGLFGTVTSVAPDGDGYVIDLLTKQGPVEVTIHGGTKYKMPGVPGPKPDLATFVGELVERKIAALVEFTDETETTANALRVMLIPNKERVHGHRVGVVKALTLEDSIITSITIVNKKLEETTFDEMLPEIKLLPTGTEVDAIVEETFVTVIYSRDPGTVNFVVKGIVVHPAIPDGWSKVDNGVELALINNVSEVQKTNPNPLDPVVGSVILKVDSENGRLIIEVSLQDEEEPNQTFGVYLEDYDGGLPSDGGTWDDFYPFPDSLVTDGDGKGEVETELPLDAKWDYVQIAVGDDWDFITEVITLVIE